MPSEDAILGNFHYPSTDQHPPESVGNQQIWDGGYQVGSIEYFPTADGFEVQAWNSAGEYVTTL